ncbi:MAG TPA: 16S rRNA (adenine(1518)-N(6)/adenine(1519)-N(6))-dimethyltransferase RsmA [Bdellovibrionota bacterium]|nr:16S rRNA (adenine(1518)-N(6)/adenine(1519)-N(6))-dimethyltransferase RsmA [Bdellovibrionota bacterium]
MKYKKFLQEAGIRPRKSLGQHFLHDENIANNIVEAAYIKKTESVVEVGPGLGILTERLLEKTPNLTVIEKDSKMQEALRERFSDAIRQDQLKILCDDALKVDWKTFPKELVVVSNLPYQISTPILFLFIDLGDQIDRMVLMFQKEVGDRLLAKPGTKAYGVLSVLVQLCFEIRKCFVVPSSAFFPAPKVTSIVLSFSRRPKPAAEINDEQLFKKVVKAAFGTRRKTLLNALKRSFPELGRESLGWISKVSGVDLKRRGETLSLQEFASLTNAIREKIDVQ